MEIHIVQTDRDIMSCFTVMAQLRTHLRKEEFLPRIRRQEEEGYR